MTIKPLPSNRLGRLRDFVLDFAALLERELVESELLDKGGALLADLVSQDDWLPPQFAEPGEIHYRQYLLHCDSRERFCVVAFVWGPGQSTPIHNHTVWGLVGILHGRELVQSYEQSVHGFKPLGAPQELLPGQVSAVSPQIGDVHQVSNGLSDGLSISIHVYGANIGNVQRSIFRDDGSVPFVSGYANDVLPNIWQ